MKKALAQGKLAASAQGIDKVLDGYNLDVIVVPGDSPITLLATLAGNDDIRKLVKTSLNRITRVSCGSRSEWNLKSLWKTPWTEYIGESWRRIKALKLHECI